MNTQDLETEKLLDRNCVERHDAIWLDLAQEWQQLHAQIKELQEKEILLRQKLIAMSGSSNSIGGGIKVSKVIRKGVVDYSAIPELREVDLERYRKPSIESWRIALK